MSSPMQHRALHISEVVRHISDVAVNGTLAVLARTCKAFEESALQALWRHLSGLTPLVKLFPSDAWVYADGNKLKFARLPLPHEWTVFLKYSKLVRSLGFRWRPTKMHANVVDTLCALRPTLVLFPNLRALSWPMLDLKGSYFPSLLSLVGDGVATIRIIECNPQANPNQLLQASVAIMASKFRYVKKSEITFLPSLDAEIGVSATTSAAMSSLVFGLHSLQKFRCLDIPLTLASILHLAELGTLQELTARLSDASPWPTLMPAFRPFALLTKITFATTASVYIAFSRAIALPHIQDVTLSVVGDPVPQLIPEFFSAIRRQYSPTALCRLKITVHEIFDDVKSEQITAVVRSAHLRPLLEFFLMKDFDMTMACHHEFDDTFILDTAKAWPRLKRLFLSEGSSCVHDVLPSLTALAHLAMYARNMRELGLRVDAAGWAQNSSRIPELAYGDLQVLRRARALFLARVFPDLETLVPSGFGDPEEDVDPHMENWEEIQRYLPMFARIRNDERLRMQQERQDSGEGDSASKALSPLSPIPTALGDDANDSQNASNGDASAMTVDTDVA